MDYINGKLANAINTDQLLKEVDDLRGETAALSEETARVAEETVRLGQVKADLVDGKIPAEELPSYVDDIVEVEDYDHLPEVGEEGKIYLTLDTGLCYRWSGSEYVQINAQDNVKVYENLEEFPEEGDGVVIYIAEDTDKLYRWNGEEYVSLSEYLPLSGGTIDGELRIQSDTNNVDHTTISGAVATHHYQTRNYTREVKVSSESVGFSYVRVQGSAKTNIDRNGVCHQSTGGIYGDYNPDGYLLEWPEDDFSDERNHVIATREWVEENSGPLTEIAWADLKALRDSGELVPGRQYRIIDYQCSTSTANTSSAGHQFDIIVTADSASVLNENARAALHAGDTYFTNNDLVTWQLKYCLDNDTSRFAWAQPFDGQAITNLNSYLSNGRPLTRQPSFDNSGVGEYQYAWGTQEDVDDGDATDFVYSKNAVLVAGETVYNRCDEEEQVVEISEAKGVIYRMIDEFSNDVPYDFKNILFTTSGAYTNAYTFSYTENGEIKDASLLFIKGCYDNEIKKYLSSNKQALNFNVFYSNTTSFICHNNRLSNNCSGNTFSYNCSGNTFYYECASNIFGQGCSDNTFGASCTRNTFGANCSENIFDFNCWGNTFGASCSFNTFGCYGTHNTFDAYCFKNIFGADNSSNTFGSSCSYNSFGADCSGNMFGANCTRNTFGAGCSYIIFGDSSSVINYCQKIIVDSGCQYIYLNSVDTNATAKNQLQNAHVHLGVAGASSARKTLTVPDRNLQYETNFIADGTDNIII